MKENQRLIPGFGRYNIDKKGVVRNNQTDTIMTVDKSVAKPRVKIINDEGQRVWFIPSKEVVKAIFEKTEETIVDNFNVDVTTINSTDNKHQIFIATPTKTKKHDFASMPPEEKRKVHAAHKVSTADVLEIRRLLDGKIATKKELGERYGMASQTIGKIGNRKIYKSVPEAIE